MFRKSKVLILSKLRYGDADLIISALDKGGGKLNFFAPSARKSKKRFPGGSLDMANFVEVTYRFKSENNLLHLKDAVLINSFDGIRSSYSKMSIVFFMLKLVKHHSKEGVVDNLHMFNLLGNSLAALEKCEDLTLFKTLFEVKFWNIQGLLPSEGVFNKFLAKPISLYSSLSISKEDLTRSNELLESVRAGI